MVIVKLGNEKQRWVILKKKRRLKGQKCRQKTMQHARKGEQGET